MEQTEIISFIVIASLLLFALLLGIIAFVNQYRKKREQHENEKAMIEFKHKEALLATQVEMQQQTMQYIGREIHDNVGQKLTLASLYSQQLSYENKAPQINDKIESVSAIINEALQELRRLSKSLTDDAIAENDFITLIQAECSNVLELDKQDIVFTANTNTINLNYQQKSILLRVVQEFIQNSLKHANSKKIQIALTINNHALSIALSDNGVGFDTSKAFTGIGLKNMQNRVALLKGTFDLQSSVNKGTTLTIEISL
jgi:signal transduction histidine kinase